MKKILIFLPNKEMVDLAIVCFRKHPEIKCDYEVAYQPDGNLIADISSYNLVVITDYMDPDMHGTMSGNYTGGRALQRVIDSGYNGKIVISIIGSNINYGHGDRCFLDTVPGSINLKRIKGIFEKIYLVGDFLVFNKIVDLIKTIP